MFPADSRQGGCLTCEVPVLTNDLCLPSTAAEELSDELFHVCDHQREM